VRTLTALSVPHPAAMAHAMVHSDQALRSSYIGFFQLPLIPEGVLLAGGGTVLRRMLRQGGLPDDRVEEYVERMREPGALTAALNWYRAMPLGTRTPVGVVRVPTLHVWGARDVFLGRAAIEASRGFVDAPYTLEVLEDVNHWIPELAADRTGELITAHVRSNS
jgi:pimeloyl-ACP methyl ester carboxylesterase